MSNRLPHPATADAFRRAQAEGIRVVLASGRIYTSMAGFADELGVNDAMICCNGAHVLGPGGQESACHRLDRKTFQLVLDYAVPRGIHVNAYTRTELLFLNRSPWADVYAQRLAMMTPRDATVDEALDADLIKISLIDNPDRIQDHIRALAPQLDYEVARFTESEPEYVEFMHAKATKGFAMGILTRQLGLLPAETAAIGDYLNDLEMLAFAKISAVVANGAPALRETATMVSPSNEDGAVAWFVDYLLSLN
jgi:Cof subfamily protein (haloacid dehalogenase superfamily)